MFQLDCLVAGKILEKVLGFLVFGNWEKKTAYSDEVNTIIRLFGFEERKLLIGLKFIQPFWLDLDEHF